MNTDPCHKCLIEMETEGFLNRENEDAMKCLRPATHMWNPVEGAEVPLCEMHAERLSKLPSIVETIKPITE